MAVEEPELVAYESLDGTDDAVRELELLMANDPDDFDYVLKKLIEYGRISHSAGHLQEFYNHKGLPIRKGQWGNLIFVFAVEEIGIEMRKVSLLFARRVPEPIDLDHIRDEIVAPRCERHFAG